MDTQTIFIIIGIITLLGTLATLTSRYATAYDTEMSLILLVMSMISFGIGFGFIDNFLSDIIDLYLGKTDTLDPND